MTPEEIVERLREFRAHESNEFFGNDLPAQVYHAAMEAADLIERQAKALEEAERALEPVDVTGPSGSRPILWAEIDAMRKALAAIRALKGE